MDFDTFIGLLVAFSLFGALMYIIMKTVRAKNTVDEESSLEFLVTFGNRHHFKPEEVEIISKKYIQELPKKSLSAKQLEHAIETGKDDMMQVEMEMTQLLTKVDVEGTPREFFTPVYQTRRENIEAMLQNKGGIDLFVHKEHLSRYSFDLTGLVPD